MKHDSKEDSSKQDSTAAFVSSGDAPKQMCAPSPCLTYKGLHISVKMLCNFHADEMLRSGEDSSATQAPLRLQTAASDAATDPTLQVCDKKHNVCAQLLICGDKLFATTMPWLASLSCLPEGLGPKPLSLSMQSYLACLHT